MSTAAARQKLSQLFNFFKAVEERRTPRIVHVKDHRWTLWLDTLPAHKNIKLQTGAAESAEWLHIIKPTINECPRPPQALTDWLKDGWDNPFQEAPAIHQEITSEANGRFVKTQFGDVPSRATMLKTWSAERSLWRELEVPIREVLSVWNRVFSLYNDLQRDGESWELMLGDGIFSFDDDSAGVEHPVVLRKVELIFEPVTKEFKFVDADDKPEFYTPVFAHDSFANLPIKKWQESLDLADLHPLEKENLDHWLKGLAGTIGDCDFIESGAAAALKNSYIQRRPLVFLRSRSTGKVQFIDEILSHIQTADSFPNSLLSIVGVSPAATADDTSESSIDGAYANEQEDVLLTKPANAEQVAILRRLNKRDGVLVQGPPGTGKTHTIANLIGNFLAEGKSVLVTSHTTKALRVVRSQVAEHLQSLCVSVLDSNTQSRHEREQAIRELAAKLSDNPSQYQVEADRLRIKRTSLVESLRAARSELLLSVQGEYTPIILFGQEVDPAEAAREVSNGEGHHDWIQGPIDPKAPAPLTDAESALLIKSGFQISTNDEVELAERLPKPDELPSEVLFSNWVDRERALTQSNVSYRKELWSTSSVDEDSLIAIQASLDQLIQQLKQLEGSPWKLAVIQAGMEAGQSDQIWMLLCENIEAVRAQSQAVAKIIFEYGPALTSTSPIDEQIRVLNEICDYLKSNTSISWMRLTISSSWKKFIEQWKVNGRTPKVSDDFIALREYAGLLLARQSLNERWHRLTSPIGMPALKDSGIEPEEYAYQYVPQIKSLFSWHSLSWKPVADQLKNEGLNWDALQSEAPPASSAHHMAERLIFTVEKLLPEVVAAEVNRRSLSVLGERFASLEQNLTALQEQRTHASIAVNSLKEACQSKSKIGYEKSLSSLTDLQNLRGLYLQRVQFLARVETVAPDWGRMLAMRQKEAAPETENVEFIVAWRWLQLSQELNRRGALSPQTIQEKIRRLTDELQETTEQLVEKLSWAGLLKKVTDEQRQSLLGWALTVKKIGAGTGRLVPQLMRQARREMESARGAVPVWIMPFSQVTSSFHPVRDKFDVLIVDEASQEDVLGVAPFYMAKQVIVVGDDKQVTPLDVGGLQAPIQQLINQWLGGLPSSLNFDLKTSVYDRAQIAFGSAIRLKEHFRCVPEIIQFSNALCYDFTIKPLREAASTNLKPALVAHRVQGHASGQTNQIEANEVVALVRACIESPAYAGKTFGVITMVGEKQADLINTALRTQIEPAIYEQRRILCGNPAQFQGDERDVIFLSLVDSKDDGLGPLTMRQDGADDMYKKRFNVAASRAKDQLWVVYSVDHQTQLKPGDIRRRLIEHAIDPSHLMSELETGLRSTESPFEAEVMRLLVAKGYRVRPQWAVGAYRIDMVVEGNGRRLAVECDGERWHYNRVEEDLARQALLERLGWKFVRIRGSTFYRDRSEHRSVAMQPVFEKLQEFGIQPGTLDDVSSTSAIESELLSEIKRRAYEIAQTSTGSTQPVVTRVAPIKLGAEVKSGNFGSDNAKSPSIQKPEPHVNHVPLGGQSEKSNEQKTIDLFAESSLETAPRFEVGMRVKHKIFGLGTIRVVRTFGTEVSELELLFDLPHGNKTIKPTNSNLEIIKGR